MTWEVKKGKTYIITVALNWYEKFAPDGMIEHKFTENGFSNVHSIESDSGKTRLIQGTWDHEDTVIPAESHLSNITEVKQR